MACLSGLSLACIDPFLVTEVTDATNHQPSLLSLSPAPGFAPVAVPIGTGVAPVPFSATLADDDQDDLIVRWLLLVDRAGTSGVAIELREQELEVVQTQPDAPAYDFRPLELDFALMLERFGAAELATLTQDPASTQLLELRVTDRAFRAGTNEPKEGAGFAYASWMLRLSCIQEGCRP